MDWTNFNTHGESKNHAFEVMCNIVFESWCKEEYGDRLVHFCFVNGTGGDGGVEAYAILDDGSIVAVQSKWFPNKLSTTQINQIRGSINTALRVRPQIGKYIVCIPRDLGSSKVGKGKNVVQNTEESLWLGLINEYKITAPDVEIELWSETRLQEMLTHDSLRGVFKFWFETSDLLDSQFELSFDEAIKSWANTKYIPDIYAEGHVHDELTAFLGSYDQTKKRHDQLCSLLEKLMSLKRAFEELLLLGLFNEETDLKEKIDKDLETLKNWISCLKIEESSVRYGNEISFTKDFCLCCKVDDLKEFQLPHKNYFHFRDVEVILETIEDDFYSFQRQFRDGTDNRLILLGNPGCGKTTAIVSEASELFKDKSHLPVLVHARDFNTGDSWSSIIEKTLGLSSNWDEDELLRALENVALLRNDGHSAYGIIPKCVICVDGLDEAAQHSFWRERIEEAAAYTSRFTRVRFVFLTRPYVFSDRYDLAYRNCIRWIPGNGDVAPEVICDAYFNRYRITVGDSNWIKNLLRTPLSLRLFCELYQDSFVEHLDKNTTVITELFKKRIEKLELDFADGCGINVSEHIINNILCGMAILFTTNDELTQKDIEQALSGYDTNELKQALVFLEREGFIYSHNQQKDDFSPVISMYSWGLQPAFDYLIARKVYLTLQDNKPVTTEYSQGVYQMLGLIALEDDGKLLFEYPNIQIDDQTMFELVCYVMANASAKAVANHRDYLMRLMKQSVFAFHEIVNSVVFPVCRVDDHPLGAVLLDNCLRSFDSPAERDVWWSVPAWLRDNYNATWRCESEFSFYEIHLGKDDAAYAAPLVLAWSLSSVNNDIRSRSRIKLLEWGLSNRTGFWNLLVHMSDVNDEQVLEDLFSIAYGISLGRHSDKKYLDDASSWILEKIFSETGLERYCNSAIRYYCSGIVKIAISEDVLDKSVRQRVIPPYSYRPVLLELEEDALNARRMHGYGPIDYDLARYVLCDHLDCFFRQDYQTHKYTEQTENLFIQYRNKYGLTNMDSDGLIISMAYRYLIDQGWNENIFLSCKEQDYVGVDSAIRYTYYPATHGSISRIMSVSEKYIWVFRHKVEALLANTIPIPASFSDRKKIFIHDYIDIENFINPYQDYVNNAYREKEEKWHNIDTLAILDYRSLDKSAIENWMINAGVPNFESWIIGNDNAILLDTFTNVVNKAAGIEETVWIHSGAVKACQFESFLNSIDVYSTGRAELASGGNMSAYMDCRGFCTPQEICMIHADKEVESTIVIINDEEIIINKLVSSSLVLDELETEKTFTLPSRFTREIAQISYGDGYRYFDKTGYEVAQYYDNGENWGTQQKSVFIDRKRFFQGLNKEQYTPFWICRVYRSPSNKAYERFRDILHDTDNTYIVWIEGENIKYKIFYDIAPPKTVQVDSNNMPSEIDTIIAKYMKEIEDE